MWFSYIFLQLVKFVYGILICLCYFDFSIYIKILNELEPLPLILLVKFIFNFVCKICCIV